MRFLLVFLALAASLQASPFVWAVNYGDSTISIIDAATNTIVKTITDTEGELDGPYPVTVLPNGQRIYVANYSSDTVSVFNTSTQEFVGAITLPAFSQPYGITAAPNGQFVYVTGTMEEEIYRIDVATNAVTTISVPQKPYWISFSPDSAFAYLANYNDNSISVLNTETLQVTTPFTGLSHAYSLTVAPNGQYAYVSLYLSPGEIAILDLVHNTVSGSIDLTGVGIDDPFQIVFSSDGATAYVAGVAGIVVIDTQSSSIVDVITSPSFSEPTGLALSPDGQSLYCADFDADLVFEIDIATRSVVAEISGFDEDYFLVIPGFSGERAFHRPSNRRPGA